MDEKVACDDLDEALRRCGASWDAAQPHGLLTGRLAVAAGLLRDDTRDGRVRAQRLERVQAARDMGRHALRAVGG